MIIEKYSSRNKCKLQCEDCKEIREVQRNLILFEKPEHPCRTCSNKRNGTLKTGKYTAWNSGKRYSTRETEKTEYINTHGYIEVWCGRAANSRGRKDGYRLQHHLAAEDKIGRRLLPNEIVHHINGNKLDNEPSNLFVCNGTSQHRNIHSQLENLSFALLQAGHIYFDENSQTYKSPLIE